MPQTFRPTAHSCSAAVSGFAEATSTALVTTNADGLITFWNPAAERMFGYAADEALGRSLDIIVPSQFREEHHAGLRRMAAGEPTRLAGKPVEVIAARRDGSEFPVEITLASWIDADGRAFGAQLQDITARRERDRRLQHLAHHDPLTGLLNRSAFHERLSACLSKHGSATLLTMDLDGFKSVNDHFGHAIGDALLQTIAMRLTAATPTTSMIARVGGDEFALLLSCVEDPLAAHATAQHLLSVFAEPFQIAGHTLQIGVSIGAAFAPSHASQVDELLLRGDLALLASKKAGGRQLRIFDQGMDNQLEARRAFKDELLEATKRGEWELFYQPQVGLVDGALLGVEALLRWRHPVRGLIYPAAFLPVLETHLVAYEVGSWVIDEACRQLTAWRRQGRHVPRMSVNLFAAQFTSGTLAEVVAAALEQHALAPPDLEIEITETIALRPDDQILSTLRLLRDAGVKIAFDDFGTGFASLTTLKHVPVTRLKIDKAFIQDICDGSYSAAIVGSIVSLARQLDLEIIAEGIETEEQRERVLALGCDAGQGYLLGRPKPACPRMPLKSRAA